MRNVDPIYVPIGGEHPHWQWYTP